MSGKMLRRMLPGEVAIPIGDSAFMDILARNLEIEADGGDSPGEFVVYAIEKTKKEVLADRAEDRAASLRRDAEDHQ